MLDPHLTKPQGEELAAMQAATVPGMAFWAGSGPAGKTCRECAHWCPAGEKVTRHAKHGEAVRDFGAVPGSIRDNRKCDKFARLSYGREGDPVTHEASACKYFEDNENAPPLVMRWAGPKGWQPIETPAAS